MKKNSKRHLIVVNMPYLLLVTLIRNKALSFYISNLIINREVTINYSDNAIEFFSIKPISRILICSFSWSSTKEGYKFWYDIYNELCDKCGSQ
jgi:hypothetical protein